MDIYYDHEEWAVIEDAPDYLVSNYGRVVNSHGDEISQTKLPNGDLKVSMYSIINGGQIRCTRSVKVLVATYFVPNTNNYRFRSVICIDGNRENVHHTNLAWRSRSFAWEFANQFNPTQDIFKYPRIRDMYTGEEFDSPEHLAKTYGVLMYALMNSIYNKTELYPTGHRYEIIDE